MTIRSFREAEAVIESAIKSESNRLSLDLSTSYEGSLPDSIGDLQNLEELTIYNSSLAGHLADKIPAGIGKLSNLKKLQIYDFRYGLEYLPESIGNLTGLEFLHIADCPKLVELPFTIGQLQNLKYLHLTECKLPLSSFEKLPSSIGLLTSLRELMVNSTVMSSLPSSLGDLKNLEFLILRGNSKLQSLPQSIGKLHNLRDLIIRKSKVNQLPESIGNLTQLENLELEDNQLNSLPESIGQLSGLKYDVALYGNPISFLPDSILNLPVDVCYAHSIHSRIY
jgi:Leucine-rich repeat (LRR) protein